MSHDNEKKTPPRAFPCPTRDCPGNAWTVVRTDPIPVEKGGGIRRVRRCLWCNSVIETYEYEAYPEAKGRPLPLAAYFQRR